MFPVHSAHAEACPVTDGGAGDSDSTVDGTLTLGTQTWTPTDNTGFDCTGVDIDVTGTLTLNYDITNGYVPVILTDDITVSGGGSITATGEGCYANVSSTSSGPDPSTLACTTDASKIGAGTATGTSSQRGGAGAGHYTVGGNGRAISAGTDTYGYTYYPILPGAQGGAVSGTKGGAGGGTIVIIASGTATINGTIVANGNNGAGTSGWSRASGGGSAGSILFKASSFSGSGSISAIGGNGGDSTNNYHGGGGAGGLITLIGTNAGTITTSVAGGSAGGVNATDGSDGVVSVNPSATFSIKDTVAIDTDDDNKIDAIDVIFDREISSASVATSDFSLSDSYTITAASKTNYGIVRLTVTEKAQTDFTAKPTVTIAGSISSFAGDATITSGNSQTTSASCYGILNYSPFEGDFSEGGITITSETTWDDQAEIYDCSNIDLNVQSTLIFDTDTTAGTYVHVKFDDITVTSSGTIQSNAKGCAQSGGVEYGPTLSTNICATDGIGFGGGFNNSTTSRGGGGGAHGGSGGNPNAGGSASLTKYDFPVGRPSFGASGGSVATTAGGTGGGIVVLEVIDTLSLSGNIQANGGDGLPNDGNKRAGGGGSGGFVYLITDTFTGTDGNINTNGGAGASANGGYGGGGGGGIVTVVYNTDNSNFLSTLTADNAATGGASGGGSATAGESGSLNKNPSRTLTITHAIAEDSDANSQIDKIHLYFNMDIDANSVAGSDFTTSRTISSASRSNYATVTLVLTEGGSTDLSTAFTVTVAGEVTSSWATTNLSSGSFSVVPATCTVADTTLFSGNLYGSTILINSDTTITAQEDSVDCTGLDMQVTNDSVLTFGTNTTNGDYVFLKIDSLTLDNGSSISSDGLGCTATTGSDHGTGPDADTNICSTSTGSPGGSTAGNQNRSTGGGGYGGVGGDGLTTSGGSPAYGDENAPTLFGSSGGSTERSGKVGGTGGGIVRIEANDTLTVNGEITADGSLGVVTGNGWKVVTGGGSGGSIYIVTETITGTTGSFSAVGGNGQADQTHYSGGGGGGRVAIFYENDNTDFDGTAFTSLLASSVSAGGASGGGASTAGSDGSLVIDQVGGAQISVADVSVDEDAGTVTIILSTPNAPSEGSATVDYATSGSTATSDNDFTATSGTATFNDDSDQTFTVAINNDTFDEDAETFTVTLSNCSGCEIADSSATVTINDNDSPPALTISDVSVDEDASTVTVTTSISGQSQKVVTVNYATSNGTATAGTHYTAASGTLTWTTLNTANKTFTIPITDNSIYGPSSRTITATLSSVSNATLADSEATVTINDDESQPTVSIADASATEGSNIISAVTLSHASSETITVNYASSDGTATAGSDYTAVSGTLTFTAGQTSKNITVGTTQDSTAEGSETITLTLSSPSNTTISDSTATLTITDNDKPSLAVADVTVNESATSVNMTVTQTGLSDSAVSVNYATADDTATAGSDYTAKSGTLTWTAGQTGGKTVTIALTGDSIDEDDETFNLNLSSVSSSATISDSQGTTTITDNDTSPTVSLSISGSTVTEGSALTLTATSSAVSGRNITVNLSHSGTASSSDINEPSSITITAGNTTGTATLTAVDDDLDESNETKAISISTVVNGTENGTQQVSLTVVDNDTHGITISESGDSTHVNEGVGQDSFSVVADSEPTDDIVITLSLANDEVSLGSTELTFTSENWDTPQTVTVTAVDDAFSEESPHAEVISFSIASDDSQYNAVTLDDIDVNVYDDDSPGMILVESANNTTVSESGTTDTFTVVLNTAPTSGTVDVSFSILDDTQISITPTTLQFDSENFDTPQTITVSADDDRVKEGTHNTFILPSVSATDEDYDDFNLPNVNVFISDDDTAWVDWVEVDDEVDLTEGGDTKDYTFVLSSEPSNAVTVVITTDSEVTASPSILSFNPDSEHERAWNIPQTVTFTAVDDSDIEGEHSSTVSFTTAQTGDGDYDDLPLPDLSLTLTDNDSAEGEGSSGGSSTGGSSSGGSSSGSSGGSSSGGSSGSSTGGSGSGSTSGSSTGGSSTGGGSGNTPVYITALTAGSTQTVKPGVRVRLRGRITKSPSGSHSAQWTQTSGPTVELTNVAALQPYFTTPSSFNGQTVTLGFKLTATTNADQKSATTSVIVRKQTSLCLGSSCSGGSSTSGSTTGGSSTGGGSTGGGGLPPGPDCVVIGYTDNGKAICEDDNIPPGCPAGTVEAMSVGGQKICNPYNKPPKILPVGDLVVVGYPFANFGRGRVVIFESETSMEEPIDPTNPLIDTHPDVVALEGSQVGDLFGHTIHMCDFNGDGQKDIYITAPNTRRGTGYMVEIYRDNNNSLAAETIGIINGGQHPLRTKFMHCLNYNGEGGDELFLPVKTTETVNQNLSFSVSDPTTGQLIFYSEDDVDDSNVAESSTAFNGLLSSTATGSSQIDFSTTNPDTTLDTDIDVDAMSSGDINADGYEDLILASTETCDIYVYFGSSSLDSEITSFDQMACQDGSDFDDLLVGDVTGDGIDDIILVFPGDSIFILPGVEDMDADDLSIDNGYTIYGDDISGITLADTDGDGDSEIIINSTGGGTTILGGDGGIFDGGSTSERTGLSNGGVSTGCQLNAKKNNQPTTIFIMILSFAMLIFIRRKRGKIDPPFSS